MAKFANSVLFAPTLGGTTDWTVNAAVQGYMTPAQAGAPDGVYKYRAESSDLSQWEVGEGTYTGSGPTLTRTTILQNSSGTTSKINFTTVPNVGIVALKEDLLSIEDVNLWTYIQQARARANLGALKKNYIVNGGMQISQENGSASYSYTNTSPNYFVVDQFFVAGANGGTLTLQQVASITPGGSPNRIRCTVATADSAVAAADLALLLTRLEGLRVSDLKAGTSAAKTVTLQFGCKGPAGTYCVAFRNGSGTTRSYIAEYTISAGEANTDVVKSVTIPLDQTGTWFNDSQLGIDICWSLMCGSTYQTSAGVWQTANLLATSNQFNFMGTNGNVFELFDVGLYEGAAAPNFQLPEFASELLVCKRYWEKSQEYGIAYNTATQTGAVLLYITGISNASAQSAGSSIKMVDKRSSPTITTYSVSTGAAGKVRDTAGGSDVTPSLSVIGSQFYWYATAAIASTAISMAFHWTANARL